jgi:cytochrome P450
LFEQLAAQPSLVPAAVEESLRVDPPIHVLMRNCTADATIDGVSVPAGAKVAFGLASANRDEANYDDGDIFRLDRANGRDHLAFGGGPHVCPGASLARLEGRIALEAFCERVDTARIDAGFEREQVAVLWANGPRRLPVTLTPRASSGA